jgi:cytochrome c-type biogenesis protein CcmF
MAVLSIAVSKGYRQEEFFTTGPGNTHQFGEYSLVFEGTRVTDEGFRKSTFGDFKLSRDGQELGTFSPRINLYTTRREPLPAPVSLVRWDHDLQLTLMSAEEDGSFAYLRVIRSPFMAWLWFSAFVIFGGTMMSIWPSAKKKPKGKAAA